jgi:hypothetical protein
MYKNSSRDSRFIKGFSPLQLSSNLRGMCPAFGYFLYRRPLFAVTDLIQNPHELIFRFLIKFYLIFHICVHLFVQKIFGVFMLTTSISEFRKNIKKYFDNVTQNSETLIINCGTDTGCCNYFIR